MWHSVIGARRYLREPQEDHEEFFRQDWNRNTVEIEIVGFGDVPVVTDHRAHAFMFRVPGGRIMAMPEGKEIILKLLGPGDFFGEMALLDDEPRSATVVSTEPLELVTIWRNDFLQILAENFTLTRKVLAELSRRLRSASSRIESLATMDVYGRLARFFLDLARDQGKVLDNGYIDENAPRPDPDLDDERRRYYRLTPRGRKAAEAEAFRLENTGRQARAKLRPRKA